MQNLFSGGPGATALIFLAPASWFQEPDSLGPFALTKQELGHRVPLIACRDAHRC